MTLFQTIKEAIAKVIRTNGNQEITGYLLQRQLFNIIDALGAGFAFMGEAKPDTDPGAPDHKVAYLAVDKGTYDNFGAVTISDEQPLMYLLRLDGPNLLEPIAVAGQLSYDTLVGIIEKAKAATAEELANLQKEIDANRANFEKHVGDFDTFKTETNAALAKKADEENVADFKKNTSANLDKKTDKTDFDKFKTGVEGDFQQQTDTFNKALATKFDKANIDNISISDSPDRVPSSRAVYYKISNLEGKSNDNYGWAKRCKPLIFMNPYTEGTAASITFKSAEKDAGAGLYICFQDGMGFLSGAEMDDSEVDDFNANVLEAVNKFNNYITPIYDNLSIYDFWRYINATPSQNNWELKEFDDSITIELPLDSVVAIYTDSDVYPIITSSSTDKGAIEISGGPIWCFGDIMALTNYDFTTDDAVPNFNFVSAYQFQGLFAGLPIIKAPQLPMTALSEGCYKNMFKGCTNLLKAPELPATDLAESCYESMFEGCTSLITPPSVLPATVITDSCYANMFKGCNALTYGPRIEAVHYIASGDKRTGGCFNYMFSDCTSLVNIPKIHLTFATARDAWGSGMFYHTFDKCTNLKNIDMFDGPVQFSGPVLESTFHNSNITSFRLCANLDDSKLKSVYNPIGLGIVSSLSLIELKIVSRKDLIANMLPGPASLNLPATGTFITNVEGLAKNVGIPSTWDIIIEDQLLDKELSDTSENAPQTKVVKAAIDTAVSGAKTELQAQITASAPEEATSADITEILNS